MTYWDRHPDDDPAAHHDMCFVQPIELGDWNPLIEDWDSPELIERARAERGHEPWEIRPPNGGDECYRMGDDTIVEVNPEMAWYTDPAQVEELLQIDHVPDAVRALLNGRLPIEEFANWCRAHEIYAIVVHRRPPEPEEPKELTPEEQVYQDYLLDTDPDRYVALTSYPLL
jgi:hypothetical protein